MKIEDFYFWKAKKELPRGMLPGRVFVVLGWMCGLLIAGCAGTTETGSIPFYSETPIIPRQVLFGDLEHANVQISPDGKYISYLGPLNGVRNIWIAPVADLSQARPVSHETQRGIWEYLWAWNDRDILFTQDHNGDENWNVFRIDLTTGVITDLTPNAKVSAEILEVSDKHPDKIVVGLNDRDPAFYDVHEIDLNTREDQLLLTNPGKIGNGLIDGFCVDPDLHVRLAQAMTPDGGYAWYAPGKSGWKLSQSIGLEDAMGTAAIDFDESGKTLYLTDSRGRNTNALCSLDTDSGKETVLAENSKSDVTEVLTDPVSKRVQAVGFAHDKLQWQVLDPAIQPDMDALRALCPGEINVTSRTRDDRKWIVAYVQDTGPHRFYLYDHLTHTADFLFTQNHELEGLPLARMNSIDIKSRDGLMLPSYYTLPAGSDTTTAGIPDHPLPMVLLVHGGPWARDRWGFDAWHQFLADRGYAVLSVNYRGSTGFGKSFLNAGNHEWGAKMQDDLTDAVHWAVGAKIADPKKVAIMGWSYGGYAALAGLTFTPDLFACGVDQSGPSRLATVMESFPAYWKPDLIQWFTRVGDNRTAAGRKFLDSRSPLFFVDRIRSPLLIAQGANDPRVKESESDTIVNAVTKNHLPVVYLVFSDEGHAIERPENAVSFAAVAEGFLSNYLGGRYEPFGDAFKNSTIRVENGGEFIPGLIDLPR